jgi:hypothetical protein
MHVDLHPHQQNIFEDDTRFKVVAAGRRFGKSYLAALLLFVEAAKDFKTMPDGEIKSLALEEVYYVAPTYEQGKKILWPLLKQIGQDLIEKKYENTGTLTLKNGRRISIKGADRPDSLRGVGLSYAVLDEYAFMKEEVWDMIVEPALAWSQGGALFIGTPAGKNHFYKMWCLGNLLPDEGFKMDGDAYDYSPEYKSWQFKTLDSPFIAQEEIEKKKKRLSRERFAQEYEASFESGGGLFLKGDMFPILEFEPEGGDYYICADLAGFEKAEQGRRVERRSDHAIAIVKSHPDGWYVKKIEFGRWDVRECALRLVRAYHRYRPVRFGIEKTISMGAVLPYMQDEMNRIGIYFNVEGLPHGNTKKEERIEWALSGRAEKGRIQLADDSDLPESERWIKSFIGQAEDFPSPIAKNDMLDALSYIDKVAIPYYEGPDCVDTWEPLDDMVAY